MSQHISIKDINLGGISASKYQGQANSVYAMEGLDIHSEPGIIKANQALTKESGTTVDDFVKASVVCSDGNTYFFGSTNGKIWKRNSSGTYSLEATASPAAGGAGILDAYEYQGYIYYAMESRLGRVAVGSPTSWAGKDDNWATFTNTDADFHPIKEVNQVMYIGDKNYVAQVDAGTFSANALDIKTPLRIKALGQILTDLLVGTFVNTYRVATEILRWNTWSVSFSSSDPVPEIGINSFLATDNYNLVSAGRKGHIYYYDGQQLQEFKKIPGSWTGTNEAYIYPNATCNMNGMPLFGLSNVSGNPASCGIYSINGYDRNYPKVLNLEWLISTGHSSNVEIGVIKMIGTTLLVSWKDTTSGTVYGIDKLDLTAKVATSYFETRQIYLERDVKNTISAFVGYRSLPTGTTIKIYYKANYNASYVEATTVVDTDRKIVFTKDKFPEANTIQFKVELNSSSNDSPEVEIAQFNII